MARPGGPTLPAVTSGGRSTAGSRRTGDPRRRARDRQNSADLGCRLYPAEVYAALLDAGMYLGSIRTFYRVLARHQEVRERRALTMRPSYQRPELLAMRPNELWSWDITKPRVQQRPFPSCRKTQGRTLTFRQRTTNLEKVTCGS